MAEALYRKYRPQTFGDVVGQEHIEDTLRNAIQQDKVSHAYLFCGPRGTGKTTTARLLAKALLCERGGGNLTPDPDGTCEDCRLVAAGEHPDVYELDAASRTGVENVREEIIGRVQFAPTRGKYKVYIIDEVHMLSTAAFNALLKTLEEPPSHVVFVLATTDPQKVPETIHSRCQRFDFRRIGTEGMVARLGAVCAQENVEFEGEALELIAHRAEGGMRNALTSLEQLIAFGKGKVTLEVAESMLGGIDSSDMAEIMDAVGRCDAAACFRWVASYVETGADLAQFAKDMAAHVRNLYVMSLAGASVALDVGETERAQLVKELPLFGPDRLARLLSVLGDVVAELKTSTNPRLSFEIALTRMVRPESELTLESLAARIEKLEKGIASASEAAVPGSASQSSAASYVPQSVREESRGQRAPLPGASACASGARTACSFADDPAAAALTEAMSAPVTPVAPAAPSVAAPPEPAVPEAASAGSAVDGAESAVTPADSMAASAASALKPAASPASAATSLPAELLSAWQNPAVLQRMWAGAMAALKKNKAAYGVLFLNTKAVLDSAAGALQIEFPPENTFVFKAVQKPEVQESVALALQQAAGVPVPFSYVQRGAGAVPAAPAARAASAGSAAPAAPAASVPPAVPAAPAARGASASPAASAAPTARVTPAASVAASAVPAASVVPAVPEAAPAASVVPAAPAMSPSPARGEAVEPMPWEDAPEPEFVPLDAYDAPAVYDPPVEQLAEPVVSKPVVEPPTSEVDARTSATPDDPGRTTEEIKDAITSVFGDGVVFQTVD